MTHFGEAFAKNCLRKFYFSALTPVLANTDYEGEVKAIGDRVNILMYLTDVTLGNYTANTNMGIEYPVDYEAVLQIDRAKYWNFNIDSVDNAFGYVNDEDSTLIQSASKVLEKAIDTELLSKVGDVQAGHIVPNQASSGGTWNFAVGNAGTFVTFTTAGTTGVLTLTAAAQANPNPQIATEGACFPVNIVGRGIRVCSSTACTPWYKITARTSSVVVVVQNWDESIEGNGISNIYLKDFWGTFGIHTCGAGYGCQIEGCKATAVTSANVYQLVCEAANKLDEEGIPAEDRHLTVPAWFKGYLTQAAQLQPDIAMYYTDTVVNGKVGRVAGFDLHVTSNDRFSTCAAPMASLTGGDATTYGVGTLMLANHKQWVTFAHKWAESRVVQAELQFANLYQGLNLYGFRVPNARRNCGAVIYGYRA